MGAWPRRVGKQAPLNLTPDAVMDGQLLGSWVYVVRNRDGRAVYVGMTDNPHQRMGQHERFAPWWGLADKIELYDCGDRGEAKRVELEMIMRLDPPENVIGRSA